MPKTATSVQLKNPTPSSATAGSASDRKRYKANFLWPHDRGGLKEAGYEFANARTELYRRMWWRILLKRAKTPNAEFRNAASGVSCNDLLGRPV